MANFLTFVLSNFTLTFFVIGLLFVLAFLHPNQSPCRKNKSLKQSFLTFFFLALELAIFTTS